MFKINRQLLPIKAHYFFFMAAMGPILPQITVFGKQLGISADVMGLITSILPILYILAKPAVGYLIDYFTDIRKVIFMTILLIMTLSYAGFYFVPIPEHKVPVQSVYHVTMDSIEECNVAQVNSSQSLCSAYKVVKCDIRCRNGVNSYDNKTYDAFLTSFTPDFNSFVASNEQRETAAATTTQIPSHNRHNKMDPAIQNKYENMRYFVCLKLPVTFDDIDSCDISCEPDESVADNGCVLGTTTFWSFVLLMCLGTIGFNVANCVSDATCFDMLGDKTMKYGAQRVWGTIGFGVTALLGGLAVNLYNIGGVQGIAPALIIMLVFSTLDVISIKWLDLPKLSSSTSIVKDVVGLLKQKPIAIFVVFATLAGIIDSFIIYFMFWHLEEVAKETGYMDSIKLIEGFVVAAECLGGEILFFLISGKILKKIGYIHCLSFCFSMYTIRLLLISLITNPWYLVLIELFMQGPTYALCYTCIVAYASAISPPGTTATVQGLVAGMDDGVGFAIGSLIGGQMMQRFGGALSFKIFSFGALIVCIAHIFFRPVNAIADDCSKPSTENGEIEAQYKLVKTTAEDDKQIMIAPQNGVSAENKTTENIKLNDLKMLNDLEDNL